MAVNSIHFDIYCFRYAAKETLLEGYDFPNLPYYFDEILDLKLTHSSAIIMHIARSNGLWPLTEKGLIEADMLREELKDFVTLTTDLCYDAQLNQEKFKIYLKNATKRLALLERKLLKSPKWFGIDLSYVDFLAYDIIDHQRILFPKILNDFIRLKLFVEDFEALPTISEFLKSNRYRKYPLWSERSFLGRYPEQIPMIEIN